MKSLLCLTVSLLTVVCAGPAAAWGDLGRRVTGLIAYSRLTPKAKARIDSLLAADSDRHADVPPGDLVMAGADGSVFVLLMLRELSG